jgi:hypothetical protein
MVQGGTAAKAVHAKFSSGKQQKGQRDGALFCKAGLTPEFTLSKHLPLCRQLEQMRR